MTKLPSLMQIINSKGATPGTCTAQQHPAREGNRPLTLLMQDGNILPWYQIDLHWQNWIASSQRWFGIWESPV